MGGCTVIGSWNGYFDGYEKKKVGDVLFACDSLGACSGMKSEFENAGMPVKMFINDSFWAKIGLSWKWQIKKSNIEPPTPDVKVNIPVILKNGN